MVMRQKGTGRRSCENLDQSWACAACGLEKVDLHMFAAKQGIGSRD